MTETRYTLKEATAIRKQIQCGQHGHSWKIETAYQYQSAPLKIACKSCGWAGVVHMADYPARPEGVTG